VIDPEHGRLAGGDTGAGRLASPESIVAAVERLFGPADLFGVSVVVSAGGTREPIDAVRVIANRSSGKQGYAIAAEAASRGADVTLVSTVDLTPPPGVVVERVETAAQMESAMERIAPTSDIIVMTAAVADFRPVNASDHKLKKRDGVPQIVLEPTPDILAGLGRAKRTDQVLVGFAAETDDLEANAQHKLVSKRLDLIVANDVSAPGAGFRHDTNAVIIFAAGVPPVAVPLSDKRAIAAAVIDRVVAARRECSRPDPMP
ncbi:MAG: bifunctional phosphopantothenoylcysteine decarboxylase/phosphopantothenate--cysteine ligase CoaBC, partial [Ilumatobacteraceae bacterium]